jgi:alanine racemase
MHNTASARIDLTALRHNLQVVRTLCPHSRIMAMLKADAYGHGAVPAARALADADGFAVARLQEALRLREAGIAQRLLLLGTVLDQADLALCAEHSIDVTAHDQNSVAAIAACARQQPLRVWLELDCGMHRLGLEAAAFAEADRLLSVDHGVAELIHMTHFSSTHDMDAAVMAQQAARLAACHELNSESAVSAANSAVLISKPPLRCDWVRPGIMLYGENPLGDTLPVPLRAVMTLCANVIAVRDVGIGERVGYDGLWTAARASRIATVGIGYADGYPRQAGNGTPVWINGRRAGLVGRVSMDSIGIDVTDGPQVAVGDEAVLWGPQLPARAIAEYAGTVSYELFTRINQRVTRDGVVSIEIARPEKNNALTQAMYEAMAEAITAAGADSAVRALLLTGQPGIFSSGNDLQDFQQRPPADSSSAVLRFMHALLGCEKPVVAAVDGPAIGIGATMLLHCDLVYLSERAWLLLPFVSLGLVPEFASSLLLPQRLGHAKAAEKLLLGEPISAVEALRFGIATAVLPPDELAAHARAMAERFHALPPGALRDSKRLMRAGSSAAIAQAIQAESSIFSQRLRSPETLEALAAFLQKRKPDFNKA